MSALKKLRRLREALRSLDINPDKGELTAYGDRFLFMPVALINSIEDKLAENLGPVAATSFQYEIGKEGGSNYADMARKAGFNVKSEKEIRKFGERLGTLAGWGRVEVTELNIEKSIARVRWINGISVRNRKGKTAVCHFGRGILTGAAEEILGKRLESIEIMCQGKGDDHCEAVIGPASEIEEFNGRSRGS